MKRLAYVLLPTLLVTMPASVQVHRRIYPAPTAPVTLEGLPGGAVVAAVQTADGLSPRGIEVPPREGKRELLVFDGNASSAMNSVKWFAPLVAMGYGVVAAEYREYGGNPGKPTKLGPVLMPMPFMCIKNENADLRRPATA